MAQSSTQYRFRRRRPQPLSGRNPQFPDACSRRKSTCSPSGIRSMTTERRPQARDQPSASRRQDRHGLSRLRPADRRSHFRRQCRPDAGRQEVRAGTRLPSGDLCHVVDQGLDPGIHPALVEPGEDGHDRQPEAAVLQPAQGEGQDPGARRRRSEARPGHGDRHQAECHRGRGHLDEPPPVRRRLAQRADPRVRRRVRRVAGLAGRRPRQPGRRC